MEHQSFIGVGSNLGEKIANIMKAIDTLSNSPDIALLKIASLYQTEPLGYCQQEFFVNTVIHVETSLIPRDLLRLLLDIEDAMGRKRTVRWGPRIIDLDILLFDSITVKERDLEIPHPRLTERAFVVVPLAEINPNIVLPGGDRAADLGARLMAQQQVTKL